MIDKFLANIFHFCSHFCKILWERVGGHPHCMISKIWLIACRSGISKISVLKDIYLEDRFIHNKLEAILFEEMRRIDLLWEIVKYTASLL